MKLRRPASLAVFVLAPALAHCEYDRAYAPPPATPANEPLALPPEPATPPEGPTETTDDSNVYASPEVELGVDSDTYDDADPSALTDFRTTLDPYGTWVDDSTYGTAWVPSATVVGADFTPYVTAGHWVYDTDYVWVSDYDWGWAPFHYGRWVWIPGRGWAWIPGRVYAGAWVSWSIYDGGAYVGWWPMYPAWVWMGGYPVGIGVWAGPRYVYCARGDVFAPVVATRVVVGARAEQMAARAQPYVPAHPGVAGGPSPQQLGIAPSQVAHAAPNHAGLARAQQFARPSTAAPLGAHPPSPRAPNPGAHASGGGWPGTHTPATGFPHGSSPSAGAPHPGFPSAPHGTPSTPPHAMPSTPHIPSPGVHLPPSTARPRPSSGGAPTAPHGGGSTFHGGGSFHGGGHR
jgi:hypothetical protein